MQAVHFFSLRDEETNAMDSGRKLDPSNTNEEKEIITRQQGTKRHSFRVSMPVGDRNSGIPAAEAALKSADTHRPLLTKRAS